MMLSRPSEWLWARAASVFCCYLVVGHTALLSLVANAAAAAAAAAAIVRCKRLVLFVCSCAQCVLAWCVVVVH